MAVSLPLVFDAPRRGMPPRHLADLDSDERKAAVQELGLPKFRADQLARQYYGRLQSDPALMTDLPAAVRAKVGETLFPPLLSVVRNIACDEGDTRKTLWKAHDGTLLESVLMRYPDRDDAVHLQPGRVRYGVSVLRDRAGRAHPQPVDRGDRRPGARGRGRFARR